jgi:hypothetical protein
MVVENHLELILLIINLFQVFAIMYKNINIFIIYYIIKMGLAVSSEEVVSVPTPSYTTYIPSQKYIKDTFNVYYNGRKVQDAVSNSFEDLGYGYGKDAFNVFYNGNTIPGAFALNFRLTGNGYATDSFNTYYYGRKLNSDGGRKRRSRSRRKRSSKKKSKSERRRSSKKSKSKRRRSSKKKSRSKRRRN